MLVELRELIVKTLVCCKFPCFLEQMHWDAFRWEVGNFDLEWSTSNLQWITALCQYPELYWFLNNRINNKMINYKVLQAVPMVQNGIDFWLPSGRGRLSPAYPTSFGSVVNIVWMDKIRFKTIQPYIQYKFNFCSLFCNSFLSVWYQLSRRSRQLLPNVMRVCC